ncbi:MAG: hypothetical protein WC966_01540 [Bradymonadales bacterium]
MSAAVVRGGQVSLGMGCLAAAFGLVALVHAVMVNAGVFYLFNATLAFVLLLGFIIFYLRRIDSLLLSAFMLVQFTLCSALFVFSGLDLMLLWVFAPAGSAIAFLLISIFNKDIAPFHSLRYLAYAWGVVYLFSRIVLSTNSDHIWFDSFGPAMFWTWTAIVVLSSAVFIWQSLAFRKKQVVTPKILPIAYLCIIVISLFLDPIFEWANYRYIDLTVYSFAFQLCLMGAVTLSVFYYALESSVPLRHVLRIGSPHAGMQQVEPATQAPLPQFGAPVAPLPTLPPAPTALPKLAPQIQRYTPPVIEKIEGLDLDSVETCALPSPFAQDVPDWAGLDSPETMDMDSIDTCALPSPFAHHHEHDESYETADIRTMNAPFPHKHPPDTPAPSVSSPKVAPPTLAPKAAPPTLAPKAAPPTLAPNLVIPNIDEEEVQTFLLEAPSLEDIEEWQKQNE